MPPNVCGAMSRSVFRIAVLNLRNHSLRTLCGPHSNHRGNNRVTTAVVKFEGPDDPLGRRESSLPFTNYSPRRPPSKKV
jgi:hypothetical protein